MTTVAVLVVADYEAQGRRSLPRCKLAVKQVKEALGPVLAAQVTYARLNNCVTEWRDSNKWKPTTIWYNLAILRRAYSLAMKEGLLATRPIFPAIHVGNARQGFFEREEFERVRAAPRSETNRNIVTMAYITRWRTKKEILPLTWDRVDFAAGVVRLDVRQSKSGAGRTFPFDAMPELRDVMGRQKLATDAFELSHGWRPRFVFFHEDGSQVAGLQKAWEKARKRVGLEAKIQHDFRRTAIRNLVRAGVSESTSMKLCGHKTRKIFDRYSIVSEHDLREGVAKLAALHEHETPQIG